VRTGTNWVPYRPQSRVGGANDGETRFASRFAVRVPHGGRVHVEIKLCGRIFVFSSLG
jgi:hypothetical protein